jgi:sugar O-acyltransferase (sialic acid O-acetyltransferase NeuD family)
VIIMKNSKPVILIGYSGHAYVAAEIIVQMGYRLFGYFEKNEKEKNPYNLRYLGKETSKSNLSFLDSHNYFIAIGNNNIRSQIFSFIRESKAIDPLTIFHPSSVIADLTEIGPGTMIGPRSVINPLVRIGVGTICNSGSIVEHECQIGDFVHIAPGATLAGNVTVRDGSFIGANSVIKEGIDVGQNVIVGAGSVVIEDVPDNFKVAGNPAKIIG